MAIGQVTVLRILSCNHYHDYWVWPYLGLFFSSLLYHVIFAHDLVFQLHYILDTEQNFEFGQTQYSISCVHFVQPHI